MLIYTIVYFTTWTLRSMHVALACTIDTLVCSPLACICWHNTVFAIPSKMCAATGGNTPGSSTVWSTSYLSSWVQGIPCIVCDRVGLVATHSFAWHGYTHLKQCQMISTCCCCLLMGRGRSETQIWWRCQHYADRSTRQKRWREPIIMLIIDIFVEGGFQS